MVMRVGGIVARPRTKPEPLEPASAGGVRGFIATVLDEEATLEAIRQTVLDALNAETARTIQCPDCQSRFRAPVPDVKKQADAIIALLEQNEGKATERPPDALTVIIERPPLR